MREKVVGPVPSVFDLEKRIVELERRLMIGTPTPVLNRVDGIKDAVCRAYGVTMGQMVSKLRTARIVWPRQVAMTLVRELAELSLAEIGERFGHRDHGTVHHAIGCVNDRCATNELQRNMVQKLREQLTK